MDSARIRQATSRVIRHFADNPDKGLVTDKAAVARLQTGLLCRAEGPHGGVVSDMPTSVGGSATAPTPGWFLRAALANCDATVIAMRAAQLGVALSTLEVEVGSESDNRGLLGTVESAPAGPMIVSVTVRIAAAGAAEDVLRELVHWALEHSPVNDAVRRAVPVATVIEVEQPSGA